MDDAGRFARRLTVNAHDIAEHKVAVPVTRIANRPLHNVARAERMTTNLLLRNEDVLGAGEEVGLRTAQKAVTFLLNLETSSRSDGATAIEVITNGREDDLVALHRAQILRVRVRHHPLDDGSVVPGMDVLKAELGQIGITRHTGRWRFITLLLMPLILLVALLERSAVPLLERTVSTSLISVSVEVAGAIAIPGRAIGQPLLTTELSLRKRLLGTFWRQIRLLLDLRLDLRLRLLGLSNHLRGGLARHGSSLRRRHTRHRIRNRRRLGDRLCESLRGHRLRLRSGRPEGGGFNWRCGRHSGLLRWTTTAFLYGRGFSGLCRDRFDKRRRGLASRALGTRLLFVLQCLGR